MPQKKCWRHKTAIRNGHDTHPFAEGERHLSRAVAAKPEVFQALSGFLVVGQVVFRAISSLPWNTEQLASVQIQKSGTAARVRTLRKHPGLPKEKMFGNSLSLVPIRLDAKGRARKTLWILSGVTHIWKHP